MKFKKEYIVLVVIIIALALYLVLHKRNGAHYELPVVAPIDSQKISKLEITKNGNIIVLNKKNDKWYIGAEEYLADPAKIKNIIGSLGKFAITALVSESKSYSRYELSEDTKITVKVWDGSTLALEFDVGSTAPTYQHTHVKLVNDANVYHARGNFRNNFDQTIDGLRDKVVLAFKQEDIGGIHIDLEGQTISMNMVEVAAEKEEAKEPETGDDKKVVSQKVWQMTDGPTVKESKINALFSSLSNLKCNKYIEKKKKEDFKDPVYMFTLKGDKEYTLSVFKGDNEDDYPAISSYSDYPFVLSASTVDKIKKNVEEMLPESDNTEENASPPSPGT